MASTFGGLETAKSGLVAARTNIDVTGHNISNANTVGYTRQRLLTSAMEPAQSTYLISQIYNKRVGQGVEIRQIQQLRSSYLDQQYRDLNTKYSYSDNRVQGLTYLEGLFDERNVDSGLTTSIENFFSALNAFSVDTSSKEYRTNVQQQALSMTQNFNTVYQEMQDLWNYQNESISVVAQGINSIAEQLAQLNESIASYERSGQVANDLRDERNLLLDELSGLANITYGVNPDNDSMVDVEIGGLTLVNGNKFNQIGIDSPSDHIAEIDSLTTQIADINAQVLDGSYAGDAKSDIASLVAQLEQYIQVSSSDNPDNPDLTDISYNGVSLVTGAQAATIQDISTSLDSWIDINRNNLTLDGHSLSLEAGTLTGGKLYAHVEMITETGANNAGIPYYMSQLNDLARHISQSINDIHKQGYTHPDGSAESVSGINFFEVPTVDGSEDYSKITAGNFTISAEILDSVYNIAGSDEKVVLSDGPTETGNNKIAMALLKDSQDSNYYGELNSIVGHLAIALKAGQSILDTKQSLLNSVDSQRTSISGVSLDEETTNLIVFQQAYNACARMVTTIDEMLNTMINGMGRVGL